MVNEMRLMVNVMVNNGEPQGSPDTEIDTELDTDRTAAAAALAAYENNIGTLTPMISNEIQKSVAKFGARWVIDATLEATGAGVRKWNYINAILVRWGSEGRGKKMASKNDGNGRLSQREVIAAALENTGGF